MVWHAKSSEKRGQRNTKGPWNSGYGVTVFVTRVTVSPMAAITLAQYSTLDLVQSLSPLTWCFSGRRVSGRRAVFLVALYSQFCPGVPGNPGARVVDVSQLRASDAAPAVLRGWEGAIASVLRGVSFVADAQVSISASNGVVSINEVLVLSDGSRWPLAVTIDEAATAIASSLS